MKKTLFTVVVLLMALVLAGCAANPTYPEAGTNYQRDPLSVPTDTPAPSLPDLPEDYDPAGYDTGRIEETIRRYGDGIIGLKIRL